jgi:hypothetical protein
MTEAPAAIQLWSSDIGVGIIVLRTLQRLAETCDFVQTDPAGIWFPDAFCMVHCEGTVWVETNQCLQKITALHCNPNVRYWTDIGAH